MQNPHGSFIWYELLTTDASAAEAFYTGVIGWTTSRFPGAPGGYTILSAGDSGIGGLMALPADADGLTPGWLGYIGVDDVDRTVAGIVADGGHVCMPATDLPDVGRIALLADPQGARCYVMKGASDEPSAAFAPDTEGHCGWNELATTDPSAAFAFYTRHFGWTPGEAMPMGALGEYRFIEQGGSAIGAMMPQMPGAPPPAWSFYFVVDDIDAAAKRVTAGGGTVVHGPDVVPGGSFILQGLDPHGVCFALVGPRI